MITGYGQINHLKIKIISDRLLPRSFPSSCWKMSQGQGIRGRRNLTRIIPNGEEAEVPEENPGAREEH